MGREGMEHGARHGRGKSHRKRNRGASRMTDTVTPNARAPKAVVAPTSMRASRRANTRKVRVCIVTGLSQQRVLLRRSERRELIRGKRGKNCVQQEPTSRMTRALRRSTTLVRMNRTVDRAALVVKRC